MKLKQGKKNRLERCHIKKNQKNLVIFFVDTAQKSFFYDLFNYIFSQLVNLTNIIYQTQKLESNNIAKIIKNMKFAVGHNCIKQTKLHKNKTKKNFLYHRNFHKIYDFCNEIKSIQ